MKQREREGGNRVTDLIPNRENTVRPLLTRIKRVRNRNSVKHNSRNRRVREVIQSSTKETPSLHSSQTREFLVVSSTPRRRRIRVHQRDDLIVDSGEGENVELTSVSDAGEQGYASKKCEGCENKDTTNHRREETGGEDEERI